MCAWSFADSTHLLVVTCGELPEIGHPGVTSQAELREPRLREKSRNMGMNHLRMTCQAGAMAYHD